MDYIFIAATILLTVYGQMIMKWQVSAAGQMPADLMGKLLFVGTLLLNPWVLSGFAAGFLAAISWIAALTKFEMSFAYPFTSLSFIFVLILGAVFFQEAITRQKVIALVLVILGLIIGSRS